MMMFWKIFRRLMVNSYNIESQEHVSITLGLAPLHNPIQRKVIWQSLSTYPHKKQAAVFDTAFHSHMQPHVYRYAVPTSWYSHHHVRRYQQIINVHNINWIFLRYGFHGTSHEYVVGELHKRLGKGILYVELLDVERILIRSQGCELSSRCRM